MKPRFREENCPKTHPFIHSHFTSLPSDRSSSTCTPSVMESSLPHKRPCSPASYDYESTPPETDSASIGPGFGLQSCQAPSPFKYACHSLSQRFQWLPWPMEDPVVVGIKRPP